MPTLNKGKKVSNYVRHDKAKDIYKEVYNTAKWRKLREGYLLMHPLCERCEEKGEITLATEVHHIKPISTGQSNVDYKELGFNPANLMALCSKCHHEIHNK